MRNHVTEPVLPRRIIRGLKVPCTWQQPTFPQAGSETASSTSSVAPIGTDLVLQQVRLRRDGLVTASTGERMIELAVSPEVVQQLETGPAAPSTHPDSLVARLAETDWEAYGIPLPSPEALFSAPLSIQWDLTSRCNLLCKHCYSSSSAAPKPELPAERLFEIVEEAAAIGVHALHFLGGEPFVRAELVDVVRHACHRGLNCHVSTNGTLITEEHARKLAGLEGLTIDVSLDSVQAEKHDWLRGKPGTYKRAVAGLQRLREQGVRTNTTCTIYLETLDEMEAIVQQAIDLGAQRLQFLRVSPVGRGDENQDALVLSDEQCGVFAERFTRLASEYADQILIDSPVVAMEPQAPEEMGSDLGGIWLTGCLAGIDKMAIRADGSVVACPQLSHVYANVQTSTLRDGWAMLHTSKLSQLGEGCAVCSFDGFCGGGCPAPHSYESELAPCRGRIQAPDQEQTDAARPRSAWCAVDCPIPCNCPTDCPLPCSCPTHCSFPCACPIDCSCPTYCALPCSCPTHCNFPCNCPTDCSCPTYCALPCSCPTHCNFPCACPIDCSCPIYNPCSCPTHCIHPFASANT